MLSPDELISLKKNLPYGYFAKVKKRTSLSPRTISSFFSENNHKYNPEVHQAALDVIEENKKLINSLKKRQKEIINEK
ncbi:hypothetical protein GCM10027284_09190 [Cyclobacterium sediminis]